MFSCQEHFEIIMTSVGLTGKIPDEGTINPIFTDEPGYSKGLPDLKLHFAA